ncbi:hypothetical protein [Rhodanobacter soli]|uniref:hypothetical protein n=1 Tax=Rhodanobacter soli TaxID=590609 RepID=UPI0031E0DB92
MAKIQALLEAKQERVRQGPSWPDANPAQLGSGSAELHLPVASAAGGEAADGRVLAPERGEQSKREG